jgi:hypothetical protein
MHKIILLIAVVGVFTACNNKKDLTNVRGWKPVYISPAALGQITSEPPRSIVNGGNIVYSGNTLYMVETGKGVHVINYSNPNNPIKERFIAIPACSQASIKNGYLIANNHNDILSIDISSPTTVTVKSRLVNVFTSSDVTSELPPNAVSGDFFECYDALKGVVERWELTTLNKPSCKIP